MEYYLGFEGYSGECMGTVAEEEKAIPFSKNLLIVTIICVINSTILISVVIFLACRKWRMRRKELRANMHEMR